MTPKPHWSIWVSPRPSMGGSSVFGDGFGDHRIQTGVSQMDKHVVSQPTGNDAGETESVRRHSRSSGWSSRVAPCLLFSVPLLWSPWFIGLGMRRLIWPNMEFPLLAMSRRRSLRTLMISLSLCPADWRYWPRKKRLRSMKKWQVPR